MRHQTKTIGLAIVLGVGLIATLGAVGESDKQRLESSRNAYEKDVQKARERYDKRVAMAEKKLLHSYSQMIERYESRNDSVAVAELRTELEDVLAANGSEVSGAEAIDTLLADGHTDLIKAIGSKVLDADGRSHDTSGIASKKYMLLYFSAQWCPPCRAFTPDLVKYYNDKRTSNNFDLVFVSSDRSARDMTGYMKSYRMPWGALPFNRIKSSGLGNKYGGRGIPNLVILDVDGEVVSGSYDDNGNYLGPRKVLRDLDELLAQAD